MATDWTLQDVDRLLEAADELRADAMLPATGAAAGNASLSAGLAQATAAVGMFALARLEADRRATLPPSGEPAEGMRQVPGAILDEIIGAASDAIAALGSDHVTSKRLLAALSYPGAGVTLGTRAQ